MISDHDLTISGLGADDIERHLQGLGQLLHASVHQGASVGFVLPFAIAESEAFWCKTVRPALQRGGLLLLIARQGETVAGTVQLAYDTPANQPHRADVKKLLVHPDYRRKGLARALMVALEDHAGKLGRTLLTLDTRTGDMAEPLYTSLGYRTVGVIPDFCLETLERQRLDSTTIMYKALRRHPPA
jgi:ribosomal protein S18 acetylase RimI-like enzyme